MKIKILLLVLVAISAVSCGGIEHEAKKAMEAHYKEVAKVPNSVKLSNADIMFSNDSLCIIHVDFTGKNTYGVELTNREEYIYMKSSYFLGVCNPEMRTNYELGHSIEDEDNMIYCTEQEYDMQKTGGIYERLDYPQGLYYLSTQKINSIGKPVNSKRKNTGEMSYVPPLTGTGKWDRAGDLLLLVGDGTFSNSATKNSDLSVMLFFYDDGDTFTFKLYEYNKYSVDENGFIDFYVSSSAEPEGSGVHKFLMYTSNGNEMIGVFRPEEREEFKQLLLLGGRIFVSCSIGKYTKSDYSFRLDVTGFDKALEILQAQ